MAEDQSKIHYCESCELEMKEDVGICDKCIWGIQMGLVEIPEGW